MEKKEKGKLTKKEEMVFAFANFFCFFQKKFAWSNKAPFFKEIVRFVGQKTWFK